MNFIEIKIHEETVFVRTTDSRYDEYILATIEAIKFLGNKRNEYLAEIKEQNISAAEECNSPVEEIPLTLSEILIV